MNNYLKTLLYLSLIFIVVFLYKNDFLVIPEINNIAFFLLSLLFVLAGFFFDVYAWKVILRQITKHITYKDAFISTGKYVLTKYIPGKVWVVLGKAGYIKEKYNAEFADISSFSFYYIVIYILTGGIVGSFILYFIDKELFLIAILSFVSAILLFFFFYKKAVRFISRIISYVTKKEISLPLVKVNVTLNLLFFTGFIWTLWSVAFYFLLLSFTTTEHVNIKAGFIFPISSVIGIVVLIAPGGIGFREGFLAFGLTALGMSVKDAASVSVLSRLWFLTGELLFFLSAIVLEVIDKRKKG